MNSLSMGKYKPAIILTLALTVFLASCTGPTGSTGPTLEWVVTTLAGSVLGDDDGTGTAAQFRFPADMAVDPSSGNLYVADANNHRIRKITPAGVVTTLAGSSQGNNKREEDVGEAVIGTAAKFNYPFDVAVHPSSGDIYVADSTNHLIRKITITTSNEVVTATVSTFAGTGTADFADTDAAANPPVVATFNEPRGVAVDSFGNLYVADYYNYRIRKITPEGEVSTIAGDGTPAQFHYPASVAVDSDNNVYVADYHNHRIQKITSKDGVVTVNTIAGGGTTGHFHYPADAAVDSSGNVYVADSRNHRIRKITPEGAVSTIAGGGDHGGERGEDDGTGTDARFERPEGVTVDSSGILYVADTWNHRIRKIEYK